MPVEPALVNALRDDLRAAWEWIRRRRPTEHIYAFGLYTTEEATYFMPFACGEEGLAAVAEHYVNQGSYASISEATAALRWSIADSPYHDRLPNKRTEKELAGRADPADFHLQETEVIRETRTRLDSAVAALKQLDTEGLFGTGKARERIILLIEAGDRSDEFVLKWAKKLNPPAVFRAFQAIGLQPEIGRWSEFGTKKVYETTQLAVTADRRLIAMASRYVGCVFEAASGKQLLCRAIPSREDSAAIQGVAINTDGARLAFVSYRDPRARWLTLLHGPRWKNQRDVPLVAQPISFVGASSGNWCAVGSTDNLIRVYNEAGESVATLTGHVAWPRGLAVAPTGEWLASIDEKSGVRIWNTATWKLGRHIEAIKGTGADWHPLLPRLATVRRWGRALNDPSGQVLRIADTTTGEILREHRVPGFEFEATRFSPDGRWLACGIASSTDSLHKEAVILEAETGAVRERLRGPFDWFEDFAFLPERQAIAIAARGHTRRPLVLWELSKWPE